MQTREVLTSFWAAMQANDWTRAAEFLTQDCPVDWPCSGEQIVGRANFVAVQAGYPSRRGRWTFDIHRLVVEGGVAVSEVTAGDGAQSARVIAFSTVEDGKIIHQVEYWPIAYDPPPYRTGVTRRIQRIP